MMYSDQLSQDVLMIIKFLSNSPIIHVSANTHPNVPTPAVVTAAANQTFAMNKWNNQVSTAGRNAGVFDGLISFIFFQLISVLLFCSLYNSLKGYIVIKSKNYYLQFCLLSS